VLIAPGLEPALRSELEALGVPGQEDTGAVVVKADAATLLHIQRHSRLAARVTVKLGAVQAPSLGVLHERARKLPWATYIHRGQPLEVRATTQESRLRHRDRVARKVELAITDALRGPRRPVGRPPRTPARIGVRVVRDRATLRIDASGQLLHRRGWRRDGGRAPLRENLAAAVLHAVGWRPGEPLVDPMCGSGTFAVEAALWTLGRPPGAHLELACTTWPCWPHPEVRDPAPLPDPGAVILAADHDARSVERTRSNARRARVDARIQVVRAPIETLAPPGPRGLVVLNPPWGERLGGEALAGQHAAWARRLREAWPGWRVATLVPDAGWARRAWPGEDRVRFQSGGDRVVVRLHEPERGPSIPDGGTGSR